MEDDHVIVFPETGLESHFCYGEFLSYFPTSKPMIEELTSGNDVYILSPLSWGSALRCIFNQQRKYVGQGKGT